MKIIFCEEELNEIKNLIKEYGDKIMAGVLDIKNAQATEKADLATLVALTMSIAERLLRLLQRRS